MRRNDDDAGFGFGEDLEGLEAPGFVPTYGDDGGGEEVDGLFVANHQPDDPELRTILRRERLISGLGDIDVADEDANFDPTDVTSIPPW